MTTALPLLIRLPAHRSRSKVSLEEALAQRRSVRSFTHGPLTLQELGQLLWAAQGVTSAWGARAAPSAGALYPLEVYVVAPEGLGHYDPFGHKIAVLADGDLRGALQEAALDQEAVGTASAVFVLTAVLARVREKYGARAERFATLEAGHAAQNLLLQAVALRLVALPVGAFDDAAVRRVLDLPPDHEPLYLVAVGRPTED